jgi:hypothetical protein
MSNLVGSGCQPYGLLEMVLIGSISVLIVSFLFMTPWFHPAPPEDVP